MGSILDDGELGAGSTPCSHSAPLTFLKLLLSVEVDLTTYFCISPLYFHYNK